MHTVKQVTWCFMPSQPDQLYQGDTVKQNSRYVVQLQSEKTPSTQAGCSNPALPTDWSILPQTRRVLLLDCDIVHATKLTDFQQSVKHIMNDPHWLQL